MSTLFEVWKNAKKIVRLLFCLPNSPPVVCQTVCSRWRRYSCNPSNNTKYDCVYYDELFVVVVVV